MLQLSLFSNVLFSDSISTSREYLLRISVPRVGLYDPKTTVEIEIPEATYIRLAQLGVRKEG